MKNTTHSNSVTRVRPSRNRCSTGIPASSGSCTTNRVAGANAAFGLIKPEQFARRAPLRAPGRARGTAPIPAAASARIGTSSSGATPPTTNTERQPKCGISAAARKPPSAAPTEKPQNMIITMVARRRRGLNSEVIAMAFGIAPPRPSPVRKRIASSVLTSWTKRGGERADAERQRREDDDLLAPDAVGQRPEHQRADHQPEQAGAEHRTERALGQAPFLGQRRRDIADRLGVEAVEEQHRRAGQQQPDLKSADRLLVDELGDIDWRCAAELPRSPCCLLP